MRDLSRFGDTRTALWRDLSWHVGDKHADRLCWLISFYAQFFPTITSKLERWDTSGHGPCKD
jgi:hypothetical protein